PAHCRKTQKLSRRLNWISRGVPTVDDITPAAALPMVAFGRSNCGWLKMLKNSLRNCRVYLSAIGNCLKTEKSRFVRCGPRRIFRPPLPYVYWRGVAHAASGVLKDVSNQWLMVGLEISPVFRRSGRLPPAFETDEISS